MSKSILNVPAKAGRPVTPIIQASPCLFMLLYLFLLLWSPVAVASAFSRSDCIQGKKALGGSHAKCAENICNWEECVDRVMTRKHATGANIQDQVASGTALATCTPHEQVMNQCLQANLPKRTNKNVWCKTGDDSHIDEIRTELERLLKKYYDLRQEILAKKEKQKETKVQFDSLGDTLKANHATFTKDKQTMRAEDYNRKWIQSGRMKAHNTQVQRGKELKSENLKLTGEITKLQSEFVAVQDKFRAIRKAYNGGDCETAWRLMGK